MKQQQRKWWSGLALIVAAALVLAACAPAATPTPQVIRETVEVEVPVEVTKQVEVVVEVTPTPEPVKIPRVAIIFSGKSQDQSFNQFMYDDAQKLADEGKMEVSFAEDVTPADFERVAGDYASQGYDLVIGHTSDFSEASLKVAAAYPDVNFAVTGGTTFLPNLAGLNTWTHQASAVAGYLAAKLGRNVVPPVTAKFTSGYAAATLSDASEKSEV
jgi:basic membrane lipoprotein Med (substrate-binding protein (PBP1-ABC) superfamily)